MAISSNNNDNDAILSEGLEIKNIQPDTKAKDLKRIADSLEKLVELQERPKPELANGSVTIAVDRNKAASTLRKLYTRTERDTEKPAGSKLTDEEHKFYNTDEGWTDVTTETTEDLLEVIKEEVKEVQAKKTVPEAEYKKLERKVKSLEQEVEDLKEVNRLLVEFQHRYNEDHN